MPSRPSAGADNCAGGSNSITGRPLRCAASRCRNDVRRDIRPAGGPFALQRLAVLHEHVAGGVPGLAWKTGDDGRGWWTLGGSPGLLIPVRDPAGRIVALKVRRRDVEPGQQRYLYVSSASRGGPSAASVVHVPAAALALRGAPLVVTEGELKADVSTALCGRPVVSLPGVGAWALALDVVAAWGAADVAVAFDMDARTNPAVGRALVCLVDALRAAGCRVATWRWNGPAKGLDDFLLSASRRGEMTHAD